MVISADFWRGKRVFLTGHTGFKGAWLSLWLQSMGAELLGFALVPPTDPALFTVARVTEGMTSTIGDIRDRGAVLKAMQNFRPEIVIHMAAQPLVRFSYIEPVETYATNVVGTAHVLEAARQTDSVRLVEVITSDKCYENREWTWGYREDEAMGGFDPYSSSKGCAELVVSAYRRSFFRERGVLLASARAGNVIGGGDWAADRLVPDCLRAFERGEPIVIRNPHSIRPWQHVLEPLSGYLTLLQAMWDGGEFAQGWNFGPYEEDAKPVQWIVEHMVSAWGHGPGWHLAVGNHPHEAHYLKLDISKAREYLHWRPHWDLKTALTKIIDWHKAKLDGDDMRGVTLRQIREFTSGE